MTLLVPVNMQLQPLFQAQSESEREGTLGKGPHLAVDHVFGMEKAPFNFRYLQLEILG